MKRPEPRSCLDVVSLLLDYYELAPELVLSPDLELYELLMMGFNKQAWAGYMSALSQKQSEKDNKR